MYIPTQRLTVQNADGWLEEARSFAEQIAPGEGTRQPCFEVWYPAPEHLTEEEAEAWQSAQGDTFDAICFDLDAPEDEAVTTLPPYAEMSA